MGKPKKNNNNFLIDNVKNEMINKYKTESKYIYHFYMYLPKEL